MEIVVVEKVEPWILDGLNALLPQLSESASRLSLLELEQIVAKNCTILIAALENGQVVGSLTLAVFRIPTGVRARIEDLVVDAAARGLGVGESLVRHAINLAKEQDADAVDLTSNPVRAAANRLYRKIGFVRRETNTFRYQIL